MFLLLLSIPHQKSRWMPIDWCHRALCTVCVCVWALAAFSVYCRKRIYFVSKRRKPVRYVSSISESEYFILHLLLIRCTYDSTTAYFMSLVHVCLHSSERLWGKKQLEKNFTQCYGYIIFISKYSDSHMKSPKFSKWRRWRKNAWRVKNCKECQFNRCILNIMLSNKWKDILNLKRFQLIRFKRTNWFYFRFRFDFTSEIDEFRK